MSYVIIENFNGGWDTRRLESAGTPGTLLELVNAHVTRGGEIEKRRAFVDKYALPAGTLGLAATINQLWVFGSGPDPGVPAGVNYQRLQHPTNPGGTSLSEILSWDTYADKLYVAALFSDGSVHHFYDGAYVENWWDGKARGSFLVSESGNDLGQGSRTKTITFEKDSEAFDVEVFLSKIQPDEDDEPESLTNGTVSVASGTSSAGYAQSVESAVNGNTSDPDFNVFSGALSNERYFQCADPNINLDDYHIYFEVNVTNNTDYTATIDAAPRFRSCVSTGGCTNEFNLSVSVVNGTSPFTYAWEVVDDQGAGAAVFTDTGDQTSTEEAPTLRVTGATTSAGRLLAVTVKCTVTDDTTAETFTEFTVMSTHWSSRTTGIDGPGTLA